MALRLKSNRCRSTTDILNENDEKESLWPARSSQVNKSQSTEELNTARKKTSGPKSQGFVKRLIASLEKRNESCQANDEFWGTYYKSRCSYQSFQNDNVAVIKYGTDVHDYSVAERERIQDKFKIEEKCESVRRFPHHESNLRNDHREHLRHRTANKLVRCDAHRHDDQRGGSLNRNLNRKGNGGLLVSGAAEREQVRKSVTLDRSAKNVSRTKSFKKFLGSVMKWRRTGEKEEPRRFLSCDDLMGTTGESKLRCFDELSKTLSLEAIISLDDGREKKVEEYGRMVRPSYDEVRIRNLPRVRIERKTRATPIENFMVSKIEESLVKPSAIKDIAKRISQYQQRPCPRKC